MKEVTDKLTDDGVRLFAEAFDKLLEGGREKLDIAERRQRSASKSTNCRKHWRMQ